MQCRIWSSCVDCRMHAKTVRSGSAHSLGDRILDFYLGQDSGALLACADALASQFVAPGGGPAATGICGQMFEILSDHPWGGQFSELCELPSGRSITHRFPQAAGWGWQAQLQHYRSRFGDPPTWIAWLHPLHRRAVCHLALQTGFKLRVQVSASSRG